MNKILEYLEKFNNTEKKLVSDDKIMYLKRLCREDTYYNPQLPRILLIGRVNSGKSMLVNAIIGKRLAVVDQLEKTAWIARYWPSENEFCYLQMKDGSVIEISIEEFLENSEKDLYSEEYLQKISRIDIGYKTQGIQCAIIDSPGFGSTNNDNELKAMESLKDADLVIYTVDVNRIGSLRETAIVDEIKKSGVPMICVGTKYDGEIARRKNIDEVIEMIYQYTDFEKGDIYPVSAKLYSQSEMKESYGMDKLLELCANISVNNHVYRANAESARTYRNNNLLIKYMRDLRSELSNVKKSTEAIGQEYDYARDRVRSELKIYIKEYVQKTLYAEYKEQLVRIIELVNSQGINEQGREIIENVIPVGYMDRYWEQLTNEVINKVNELWNERLVIDNERIIELKYLLEDSTVINNMEMSQIGQTLKLGYNKELSEKGVKLSFGVAGLASVYEALLGANAAYVALSSALVSTGLPIMLIGCGITAYWFKKNENVQNNAQDIRVLLEYNISRFAECIIDKCMFKLQAVDEQIKVVYLEKLANEINKYCPVGYTLNELLDNCDMYIDQLHLENSNLPYYDNDGKTIINQLYESKSKIEQLKEELEKKHNENIKLDESNKSLSEKLKREVAERTIVENKYNTAEKELTKVNEKLNDKKRLLQASQNEVSKLRDKEKTERQKKEDAEKRLEKSKQREKELEEKLKNSKALSDSEKADLNNQLEKIQIERVKEKINLDEAEQKYSVTKEAYEKALKSEKEAKNKLKKAEKEVQEATNKCEASKVKLDEADQMIELLEKDNKELEEKLRNSDEEIGKLRIDINNLTSKLNEENVVNIGFSEKWKRIEDDLDKIIHNGSNKYVLNNQNHPNAEKFYNLQFLEEKDYNLFLKDFSELLGQGNGFINEHKKSVIELINNKYIYTRQKTFRVYYTCKR